jgi:hypothetical protein
VGNSGHASNPILFNVLSTATRTTTPAEVFCAPDLNDPAHEHTKGYTAQCPLRRYYAFTGSHTNSLVFDRALQPPKKRTVTPDTTTVHGALDYLKKIKHAQILNLLDTWRIASTK